MHLGPVMSELNNQESALGYSVTMEAQKVTETVQNNVTPPQGMLVYNQVLLQQQSESAMHIINQTDGPPKPENNSVFHSHGILVKPDDAEVETNTIALNKQENCSSYLLTIIVSWYMAVAHVALFITAIVQVYQHTHPYSKPEDFYFAWLGALGMYSCFLALYPSSFVYEIAAFVYFFFAGIMFSLLYITFAWSIRQKLVQDLNYWITYRILPWPVYLYLAIQYLVIAWVYDQGGRALSLNNEALFTEEKQKIKEDEINAATHAMNAKNYSTTNRSDKIEHCLIIGCSLLLAIIHIALFISLVHFRPLSQFMLWYVGIGVLGFYSCYIAWMHSIVAYRIAAGIYFGLAMLVYSVGVLAFVHAILKFGTDINQAILHFFFAILALLLAFVYQIVAYFYHYYQNDTTQHASILNLFVKTNVILDTAPNEVEYKALDTSKLYKNDDIEEICINTTPQMHNAVMPEIKKANFTGSTANLWAEHEKEKLQGDMLEALRKLQATHKKQQITDDQSTDNAELSETYSA